jgi:hypothetical protein
MHESVFKMIPKADEEMGLHTALSPEQLARVEAMVWARRILETKTGTSAFGVSGTNIPDSFDLRLIAEFILGYELLSPQLDTEDAS